MNQLSKYYEDTLKKIDQLLNDKQYEEAFEIISQEIASPYIPSEYIEKFEKLYVDVNKMVMINQIQTQYNNMNKMEMLAKIYDGKKFDINLLSFFLGKFHKSLDNLDLQYLNKIFQDKDISNNEKIFALEQIKLSEIDYTFEYTNSIFKNSFQINSQSDFEFNKNIYFQSVLKKVNDLLFKNPSQIVMCREILLIIYEYYFSNKPNYEIDYLAQNLINYVNANFDNKQHVDKQFKQWIEDILNAKKILN